MNAIRCTHAVRSKSMLIVCLLLVLAILAIAWPQTVLAQDTPPPANGIQRIAIPSYFYPGHLWTQMEDAAPLVGLAIINPASGPGAAANPDYALQVAHSQAAGISVIGYVHTSYGARSMGDVTAEIDAYYAYYPTLDGIFLDEVSTECNLVDSSPAGNRYYQDLYDYINAQSGQALVVINPGTATNECYVAASDIIVTFEGPYSAYISSYTASAWVTAYNPSHFWHLVYDTVTIPDMRNALALSKARHAGWVYVTPDRDTGVWLNPWDSLPTSPYWEAELAGAQSSRAAWVYGFGGSQWQSTVQLDFLVGAGVNQAFVSLDTRKIDVGSASYDAAYASLLADFITQANSRGVQVHAMTLEDPVFTYTANHAAGAALVQHVLAYNSAHPTATLRGVHIDTEPHTLPEWVGASWAQREALMQQYTALLSDLRGVIGPAGSAPEFSAAIAWWYNEQAIAGNLPSGAATNLAQYLDALVPMVYDGVGATTADIITRVSDEVQTAPTLIGIGASELGSYAAVATTTDALTGQFVASPNYRGVSVFGYHRLPVWPIHASNTPDYLVNDRNRLSSTFGPRLKASENDRYDWHRGVDIPADCNTPVHAIASGTVRLAGIVSGYEDRMVQIRHNQAGGGYFYSNYLHLTSVTVAVNDVVSAGQLIAHSGETGIENVNPACKADPAGGFDHLHFEIRNDGVWQENAVHPLTRLAYPDRSAPQVAVTAVNVADPAMPTVDVRVELPSNELDLNRVEVVLFDNSDGAPVELSRRMFDMHAWSAAYTPHPSGTSDLTILDTAPAYDGVYDGDYGAGPVSPAPLGVAVRPAPYGYSPRTDRYRIDFTFVLSGAANAQSYFVRAQAVDVNGNYSADYAAVWLDNTPPIIDASATTADGAPYAAGVWTNQPVTVHFTCSDAGSGVASCTADQSFSADGVTSSVNGEAIDNAGNSASAAFGPLQIDRTAPETTVTAQPPDHSASADATFAFTGADATSGVARMECSLDGAAFAPCASPQTYIGLANGNHTFQARAVDHAGNVESTPASAGWTIQTDTTPPVITPAVAGDLGANGWYVSDVTVSWGVTDDESTISTQSGCDPITIDADTPGVLLLCSATSAGGSASESVTIKRDATAPTIIGQASPPPNGAGWCNGDVTVSFGCADATAGVAACGPDQVVSGEGFGQFVAGVATDLAGNNASAVVSDIHIDRTPPVISASASPAANGAGWRNQDVTVEFACSDDGGSGVAACSPTTILVAEGADQPVSGAAVDLAGNNATTVIAVSLDKTPPTAFASVSPAPNMLGWYSSDVTVSFDGSDALSGLADCSAPALLTAEVAGQSASGVCTDAADNTSAPAFAGDIHIDKTPPETQLISQPPDPSNVGDAAFNFSGSDATSGVIAFACSLDGDAFVDCSSGAVAYILLGSGLHTFAVVASDAAGNVDVSPAEYQWIITLPAPTIQHQVSGPVGDNGWYLGDTAVSWQVDGNGLTIESSSGCDPQVVTSDTAGVTFTCTATSQGGTSTASVTIQRDATVPTISAGAAPPTNGAGWNNSDVTVSFTCADALSGVAVCAPEQLLGSEGVNQSANGVALDQAGNSATATLAGVHIDKTPPIAFASASPAPNSAGWRNGSVIVSFSGSDNLSGVAGCTPAVALTSEGANQHASGVCVDVADNVSAAAAVDGVNIDLSAPVVNVTGVANGATYVLGSVPTAGCTTQDALSGVATPAALSLSGGDAQGQGQFVALCSGALDRASNGASASAVYWVGYSFSGFYQPVDNPPVVNSVKAGQAIPLKFSLAGDHGLDIFAPGYPASQQAACNSGALISDLTATDSAGGSGLQYDAASGRYNYTWKSEKAWAGQCRLLVVRLKDGTEQRASFKFR